MEFFLEKVAICVSVICRQMERVLWGVRAGMWRWAFGMWAYGEGQVIGVVDVETLGRCDLGLFWLKVIREMLWEHDVGR